MDGGPSTIELLRDRTVAVLVWIELLANLGFGATATALGWQAYTATATRWCSACWGWRSSCPPPCSRFRPGTWPTATTAGSWPRPGWRPRRA